MLLLAARPDFGFGNPNLAAAFFAMLTVAAFGYPCTNVEYRRFYWIRIGLGFCFSALVIATASRGGVVALVAGLLATWAANGLPIPTWGRAIGVVCIACALIALSVTGRMGSRLADSSLEDGSVTSRLEISKKIPAMLVAAPGGWGWGNASNAYHNWFQDKEDTRIYRHLISTHATWMVEMGWGLRFLYVFSWFAMLIVCRKSPQAFGVWVAFGVAGAFSHVASDWRLWAVPVLMLAWALWNRVQVGEWPRPFMWASGGVASIGVIGLLAILGWRQDSEIRFRSSWLSVGGPRPSLWFFAPDPRVMGLAYGKLIREQGNAGVVWDEKSLESFSPPVVVLSGSPSGIGSLSAPFDLIWLNPPGKLDEKQRHLVKQARRKAILWGDMRTDANARDLKIWFQSLPDSRWTDIRGAGLLLWNLSKLRTIQ